MKVHTLQKKNCANCDHFSYYEGNEYEGEGPNGYYCEKRDEAHEKMNSLKGVSYIDKSKKCFEKRDRFFVDIK